MKRRSLLVGAALALVRPARADDGWSAFDQTRPLYLAGRVVRVSWRHPHAELDLEGAGARVLPADLATRVLPAQVAPVDGARLLKAATWPTRQDRLWHVELAPLTRLDAWRVAPLVTGQEIAVLGYTHPGETGDAVLRAEYLFLAGRAYGLRSPPA